MAQRLANEFDIHVPASLVYTATLATIDYMKEANRGKKVFVIGEAGLIDLILEAGFEWDETNPDYVVVDLIQNYLTKSGFSYLSHSKGALFIGTNPDKNIPTERGLLPGAGSVVTFVETATQTKPVYIGKPKAIIMERAIAHLGVEKSK